MKTKKPRIGVTLVSVFCAVFICCCHFGATGQVTVRPDSMLYKKVDTAAKPVVLTPTGNDKKLTGKFTYDSTFSPRKATIRSAIIPGWGQIYNHQVWKLPFVYAAIGSTAGIFFFNLNNYKDLRRAYILKTDTIPANDSLIPFRLRAFSANGLQRNRDLFRQNVDYSVLAFLIAWGLNVVDATVSAHLRQFDVTDDLSLKFKPTFNPQTGVGVGLVVYFK